MHYLFSRFYGFLLDSGCSTVGFYTLFYLRFVENADFTSWRSVQRSKPFYTWAGNTFELLVIEHMPKLADALRIKEYATPFSWKGKTPDDEGVQVDLIIPATARLYKDSSINASKSPTPSQSSGRCAPTGLRAARPR